MLVETIEVGANFSVKELKTVLESLASRIDWFHRRSGSVCHLVIITIIKVGREELMISSRWSGGLYSPPAAESKCLNMGKTAEVATTVNTWIRQFRVKRGLELVHTAIETHQT
jgi:hypothetical protein